jgi:hypothetical protein
MTEQRRDDSPPSSSEHPPFPLASLFAASLSRRRAMRGLAAALPAAGVAHGRTSAQGETVVGVAGPDLVGVEFVGKIEQRGSEFTAYVFVTHVQGLDDGDLFATDLPEGRNETAARLTLFGTADLTSRAVVDTLFVITGEGTLRFFFNEPGGADFAVPESFFSGSQVAEATIRIRSTVKVHAPNQGLAEGTGSLAYATVEPFRLAGGAVRLGEVGLIQAIGYTGQGTLLDPDLPRSTIVMAGDLTTLG